ncbi:hypothetical protein J6590_070719 [Homalodisca vitripennis]|nr:hypothetical protein J6590_070719 [Homalodisca vitripennis]
MDRLFVINPASDQPMSYTDEKVDSIHHGTRSLYHFNVSDTGCHLFCITYDLLASHLKQDVLGPRTEGLRSALARLRQRTSNSQNSPDHSTGLSVSGLGRLSLGGVAKQRTAVLLQRSGQPITTTTHSAPGSPCLSVSSAESTTDLISTASSALRRLHFKSAGGYRRKPAPSTQGLPKVVIMGSGSVSVESVTNYNNTSTDSSNTVITMVTVTDSGETEDSFDQPPEDTMRITTNLLEDMLGNTPGSSLEKEDEFFSASSTEEQPRPCDDVKMIFHGVEEEEDTNTILLQHTKIPTEDTKTIVEETTLPGMTSSDPALEWYNIKMRQSSLPQNKNNMSTNKRLKLLSKRYAKNNFEDEGRGRKHGRNSSGFAAEQMTIESEEDPAANNASPPVPDSPTAIMPTYEPSKSPPPKTETVFTFPEILHEEEKRNDKSPSVSKKLKTEKDASNDSCRSAPPVRVNATATIVVQQASVTGNSPEFSGSESISQEFPDGEKRPSKRKEDQFKQLLDVTNNITIQQMHESGYK